MIRLITWLMGAMAAVLILCLWVWTAYTPPRAISYPHEARKDMRLSRGLGALLHRGRSPAITVECLMSSLWTDSQRAEVDRMLGEGMSPTDIARALDIRRESVRQYGKVFEEIHGRQIPAADARAAGVPFTMPEGHKLKGVSALVDGEGKEVLRWVKTTQDLSVADVVENIREAFAEYEGKAEPVALPAVSDTDTMTLYPWADWHMGLYAWHEETGTNWDLKIAENVIGSHFDELVRRSPPSRVGVILGGGDLIHADNSENRTLRSGNVLDVDGRFPKVIQTTCRLTVRCIDAALGKHQQVIVRILPGNHDPHASVAIAYFLMAWYRNEPRVQVDVDPSLFWWFRFGKVMLGATHGDNVKIKDMPMLMAHRMAADWGATKFRYVHGFHIHHKSVLATEGLGCICETHQTPAPQDAWHFGAGFLSGRSLKSITYHQEYGEISRSTLAILDAISDNRAA